MESEWKAFALAHPQAAQRTYERLTAEPLVRIARRQFPLKGAATKPFWEYEATAAFRIYYATNSTNMTVIVAARNDVHSGSDVVALIKNRRMNFEIEMRSLRESAHRLEAMESGTISGKGSPKKKEDATMRRPRGPELGRSVLWGSASLG